MRTIAFVRSGQIENDDTLKSSFSKKNKISGYADSSTSPHVGCQSYLKLQVIDAYDQ